MSRGRVIGVVGPSGVGKDSVMRALAATDPAMHLVRRVITRAPGQGGEAYDSVTPSEFARRAAAGDFALAWDAHELSYGVPREIASRVAAGQTCLVNLSRTVLAQAAATFEGFITLHLTAPTEVLAKRLATRGRESTDEIASRLTRQGFELPTEAGRVLEVANTGPLDQTVARVRSALQSERV